MNSKKVAIILVTALLLSSAILTDVQAKSYYKWSDLNGTTHYSERPPAKSIKNMQLIHTQGWKNNLPTSNTTPLNPPHSTAVSQSQATTSMTLPSTVQPDPVTEKSSATTPPRKPMPQNTIPPTEAMPLQQENRNTASNSPAL